jgi:multidrug efflux pump subunit AcrA (membrane-fusion protein)
MHKWVWGLGCGALLFGLVGYNLLADVPVQAPKKLDKPIAGPSKEKDSASKPATHKVEKGPIKLEVTLKGILESGDMTEIALRPEAFTPDNRGLLVVEKVVEHGTPVKKGDVILACDLEKIDQMIKDAEREGRLADLSIKLAEQELPTLEKLLPIEMADAERSKKIADEDLKYYLEVERPLLERSANHSVKMSTEWLEYAKEELHQLEKMYRSKDLTEETEEIILRRTRNQVENAAFFLELSKVERDHTLKVELPRRDVAMNQTAIKQGLQLDKARATYPLTLNQKRLSLNHSKYERNKAFERLKKLKKDRAMMTVKAPCDGIVYYGKCVHGQWSTASMVASKLQRGGMLQPEEVVLTIVKPRPIFVRAVVEEKDLYLVKPDLKGKVVLVPFPDTKLPATVESVSAVPVTAGNFEARIGVELGPENAALMPGMAVTVKFIPYAKRDALTVPSAAVFADDIDEDEHYVYLVGKDGKHHRHAVKVGKTVGTKTEILGGLKEGDEILQEKPGTKSETGGKKG